MTVQAGKDIHGRIARTRQKRQDIHGKTAVTEQLEIFNKTRIYAC
jgi:hypothetical protein